jgi:hypothetical protein
MAVLFFQRRFYQWGEPVTICIEGWVCPRAILDVCGKSSPHGHSIPRLPFPLEVAVQTMLHQRINNNSKI